MRPGADFAGAAGSRPASGEGKLELTKAPRWQDRGRGNSRRFPLRSAVHTRCNTRATGPRCRERRGSERPQATCQLTTKQKGRWPETATALLHSNRASLLLLDFEFRLRGATLSHIHLGCHLAGERVPSHQLVLAGRNVLDLKRTIIFHNRVMGVLHREEEALHELMLVALQPQK